MAVRCIHRPSDFDDPAAFSDALCRWHGQVVTDVVQTDVFIVDNPLSAASDITLMGVLHGSWVVTLDAYCGDKLAVAVRFLPLAACRRSVWVGDAFKMQQAALCRVLDAHFPKNWRRIPSAESFVDLLEYVGGR